MLLKTFSNISKNGNFTVRDLTLKIRKIHVIEKKFKNGNYTVYPNLTLKISKIHVIEKKLNISKNGNFTV